MARAPSGVRAEQRTPDERAEAVISGVLAGDVVEQQTVVRRRRAALVLGERYPRDAPDQLQRLQWAVDAAERYQVVVDRRQADWLRNRGFDRDLVERVLLTARIADFRDPDPRAGGRQPATGAALPRVSTVAAVLDYLRKHHPPTD